MSSKNEWEKEILEQELLDGQGFFNFLKKRQLLEKTSKHAKAAGETQSTRSTNKHKNNSTAVSHTSVNKENCMLCGEDHAVYACKLFLEMSVSTRIEQTKERKACLNCLRLGHIAINCKSQKCRKCGKSHNTLLHLGETANGERVHEDEKEAPKGQDANDKVKELVSTDVTTKKLIHRVLPTAIVEIVGKNGQTHKCNILLDSGSQFNFTARLCSKLGLRIMKADISLAGVNQVETKVLETTKAIIRSMHSDFKEKLMFMVIPKITACLFSKPLKFQKNGHHQWTDIPLAHPNFYKPKKIDLLI
ncbi:PREDICTED: uncharacterized protein LOC105153703 [Acromyrmex echinatior]|uniref:uncharacterized protein LOC105153703 n=1 Tax=Acromyrmex echinatior TaxID=103372 RepID=UPI000580FCB6|nr:PREDICTED: uncharacterized protein LOC105153703 [Acromyrmex echinatior]